MIRFVLVLLLVTASAAWSVSVRAAIGGVVIPSSSSSTCPSLWADPPTGFTPSAGIDQFPSLPQPSQACDLVGVRVQNPTASSIAAGYVTFGLVFQPSTVRPTDTIVARVSGTNYYTQMDVKATNSDGSVRHAILTFKTPSSINANSSLDAMLAKCLSGCPAAPSPAAPTASALAGGSYDVNASYHFFIPPPIVTNSGTPFGSKPFVQVTCVNGSGESNSYEIQPNNMTLAAPASGSPCYGGTGWNVYAGATSGSEEKQNSSLLSLASNYTLPSTPSTGGATPPSSNTAAIGTASSSCNTILANAISGSTVVNWLSGSAVNEFDVAGSVSSSAGTKLRIECEIRAYADGTTTTDLLFADDWYRTSGQGDLNYTVSTTQDSYSSGDVQQWQTADWVHRVSSSGVISPNIQFDAPYMMASGAYWLYDTSFGISDSHIASLYSGINNAPMSTGQIATYMPEEGGREDLGPMPNWYTMWLLSQDYRAFAVMMSNANAGGTIPWQATDENTGDPLIPANVTYSATTGIYYCYGGNAGTLTNSGCAGSSVGSNNGVSSDGQPYSVDSAHTPDTAYVPYLVTGLHYQLYWLQDAAAYGQYSMYAWQCTVDHNGTGTLDTMATFVSATGGAGYCSGSVNGSNGNETRAAAWRTRFVKDVAYASPDSDPNKSTYTSLLSTLMAGSVDEYVTNSYNSGFGALNGIIAGRTGPNTGCTVMFEQGFVNAILMGVAQQSLTPFTTPSGSSVTGNAVQMINYLGGVFTGSTTNGANFNPLDASYDWIGIEQNAVGDCTQTPGNGTITVNSWATAYSVNESSACGQNVSGCVLQYPPMLINEPLSGLEGYGAQLSGILAQVITYTKSAEAVAGYAGVLAGQIYAQKVENLSGPDCCIGTLAASYQDYPSLNFMPVMPDGVWLNASYRQIDTSNSASVTLSGSANTDCVLAVVGSGTSTLTSNSASGGNCILAGGGGAATLTAGAGNDYLVCGGAWSGYVHQPPNSGAHSGSYQWSGLSSLQFGSQAACTAVDGSGANSLFSSPASPGDTFKFNTNSTVGKSIYGFRHGTDTLTIKSSLNGGSWTAASVLAAGSTVSGSCVFNMTGGMTITTVGVVCGNLTTSDIAID